MKLKDTTVRNIRQHLKEQGVSNKYLLPELSDHIASDMEHMLDQGLTEKEAWDRVFRSGVDREVDDTARQYNGILNTRYFRSKIFLWATFGLFAISWLFSFRSARILSLFSFLVLGVTLVTVSLDFFRSARYHWTNIWLGSLSLLSSLLVMSGFFLFFLVVNFGINTHGHGVDLMIFSYLLMSVMVFFYFLRQKKFSVSPVGKRNYTWFLIFSVVQLFLAFLSFLSLPFYSWAVDYIWLLIWIILGVNMLSFLACLILRIRNVLYIILLLLSFMITFIHSPLRRLLPAGKPDPPAAIANIPDKQATGSANFSSLSKLIL